jgi:beta-lactamase class A
LALVCGCAGPRCPAETSDRGEMHESVLRAGAHGLINPILDVEPSIEFRELRSFKHKVERLVDRMKLSGRATHVSIYFRDLNNGPLFGFNEKEKFSSVPESYTAS